MRNLLLLVVLLASFMCEGQESGIKQTLRGTVLDQELETPIIGARVFLFTPESDTLKAMTDYDGTFAFRSINIGRYKLAVSMIGYEPRIIPDIILNSGKEQVLNVTLQESTTSIDELVIKGNEGHEVENELATVSARSFSVEEANRYAGGFSDPARIAQSFAGVASNDDSSNEIVIRGNSPRGVLWRLEGVEIPNPNHFSDQGASGGAISMLNSNMMANSDFYTGAFPSDYGNALSGVFDIRLRKGNNETREYSLGAGVLGLDATLEGPFKKGYQGSYLVNYRYSTLKLLNAMGVDIAGDALPIFQDLAFNFNLPTKSAGNFTIFGLGGISLIEEEYDDYKNNFKVSMGVGGITHSIMLGKKTVLKSVISPSITINNYSDQELDSLGNFYDDWNRDITNLGLIGASHLTHKVSSHHTLKTGVKANRIAFDMFFDNINEDTWQRETYLESSGHTWLIQSYVAWKWRLNERLTFNSGLHYTHFALNGYQTIEPRAGMRWQVSPGHFINAGFGIHSRREDLSLYFGEQTLQDGTKVQANKGLEFAKAQHYVLGYETMIGKNFNVKSEVYYQNLYNVPIIDDPNSYLSALNFGSAFTTDSLSNKGTGTNYGIELTVERYLANSYFFMVTSSLFDSKYVAGDGIERNTRYNGNYAFSFSAGKEFYLGKNKNNTLMFSMRGTWAGGRRTTPILLDESIAAGYEIRDETRVFEAKNADYLRLDFKCSYSTNKKKSTRIVKLDIQNTTNRGNVFSQYFDAESGEIQTSTQLGLVPVLSYQIIF